MSEMMRICPKCGSFKINKICGFCNVERIETETTSLDFIKMDQKKEDQLVDHYIETLIKDSYDPEIAKLSGVDSYRIINNCGDKAGQTVKHIHFQYHL